jgi:hypothetical protein
MAFELPDDDLVAASRKHSRKRQLPIAPTALPWGGVILEQ